MWLWSPQPGAPPWGNPHRGWPQMWRAAGFNRPEAGLRSCLIELILSSTRREPSVLRYKTGRVLPPVLLMSLLAPDALMGWPRGSSDFYIWMAESSMCASNPHHATEFDFYNWSFHLGAGGPRGATPRSRSGGAAMRRYSLSKVTRYSLSKVRSSGCALREQLWRDTPCPR